MLSIAESDSDRNKVLTLFLESFKDIAPNAVPMTAVDYMYDPVIVQATDDETGELVGGALSCRTQFFAGVAQFGENAPPQAAQYLNLLSKHSELDLIAVRPDAREHGIGSAMISKIEKILIDHGIRVWIGCATPDMDIAKLRKFYGRHGFTVLPNGAPFPPLLGFPMWSVPVQHPPAFNFYKTLKAKPVMM